jgi:8-oxo-dGTP pyrophosphatase MutT (NUDIX family)
MSNFEDELKVIAWKKALQDSGCTIHAVDPLQLLHKGNGELLFALLKADISAADGQKLLPYVFIRGDAVIVVPLVKNSDTGEQRFLMVEQHRVANGAVSLEFPAGMLDHLIDNPAEVAKRELFEETGVAVTDNDLFALCEKPLYSSPGASDEAIHFMGCLIEMKNEDFLQLEGKLTGEASENEHIRVTLKTRKQALPSVTSVQVHLAFYLFDRFILNAGSEENT